MEFIRSHSAKKSLGVGNKLLQEIPKQMNELEEWGFVSKPFKNTPESEKYFTGKCLKLYKRRKVSIYFIDRIEDQELIACIYYPDFGKSEILAENIITWFQNNIPLLNGPI